MKKLLLASAFAVLGASAAQATDLPIRAPAQVYKAAPAYSWTGLYGGISGGYGWGENNFTDTNTTLAGKFKPAGGFGGVQLGYNYQFTDHWVIGAQIDVSGGSIKDTITTGGATGKNTFDAFGTARTRLGYVMDRTMIYGTAGAIWLRDRVTASGNGNGTDSSQYHVDWVFGGGIEYAIDPRWSVNLEYLYAPFDTSHDVAAGGPTRTTADANFSLIRAGLNYRFSDVGAPVNYMPTKSAPVSSNWSGSYIGLNAGYGWSSLDKFDGFDTPALTANLSPHGFYGGIQGGYNWVYAPNALIGVEIDSSYGDLKQTATGAGVTATGKIQDLGTARLRLGYIMNQTTLLYATGGAAYAREKSSDTDGGNTQVDHLGWTVGAGAEYMFAPQWSVKAEYLYADLGSFKDGDPTGPITKKSDLTLSTVRVGINYYGSLIERLFTGGK